MLPCLKILFLVSPTVLAGITPASEPPLIDDAELQAAGMYRYWETQLPIAENDALVEGHLVDGALYVITDNGIVFAIEANAGLIRWGTKLTEPDYRIHAPRHVRTAAGDGPVVFVTSTKVVIHDRFSGDVMRSFMPEFAPSSAAVGYDNRLFLAGADGRFHSLLIFGDASVAPFRRWDVLSYGLVTAAPMLYDRDTLVFASNDGRVFACRGEDKALLWSAAIGGAITGDPALDDTGVYAASLNRSLYKLRRDGGRMLWRVRFPRPLAESPIATALTVFQYCPGEGLFAIAADTGEQKWRNLDGRVFAAHSKGRDVIFSHDRNLLVVDHDSGNVRYTIAVNDAAAVAPNTRNDVFMCSGGVGGSPAPGSTASPT